MINQAIAESVNNSRQKEYCYEKQEKPEKRTK
jgi:hypothetical protein